MQIAIDQIKKAEKASAWSHHHLKFSMNYHIYSQFSAVTPYHPSIITLLWVALMAALCFLMLCFNFAPFLPDSDHSRPRLYLLRENEVFPGVLGCVTFPFVWLSVMVMWYCLLKNSGCWKWRSSPPSCWTTLFCDMILLITAFSVSWSYFSRNRKINCLVTHIFMPDRNCNCIMTALLLHIHDVIIQVENDVITNSWIWAYLTAIVWVCDSKKRKCSSRWII